MAFGLSNNQVLLWDYKTNTTNVTLDENSSSGYIKIINDGRLAFSGPPSDQITFIYDKVSNQTILLSRHSSVIEQLSNGYLATFGSDNNLTFWSICTQRPVKSIGINGVTVQYLRQLKSLPYLVVALSNATMLLFDTTNYTTLQTFTGFGMPVIGIEDLGNGKFVSGSKMGSVFLWNKTSSTNLNRVIPFGTANLYCLTAIGSDLFVVGANKNTVALIQVSLANVMSVVRSISIPTSATLTYDLAVTSSKELFMSFDQGLLGRYDLTTWSYISIVNIGLPSDIIHIQVYGKYFNKLEKNLLFRKKLNIYILFKNFSTKLKILQIKTVNIFYFIFVSILFYYKFLFIFCYFC